MFSRIHNKLGTAGLVVAIVALVAALSGAALAAGGLTSQQEKQVKKIAKKYAGKDGAPGTVGPVGPLGPKGDAGAGGKDGTNGTNGVSPAGTVFAGEANGCKEGGVKFVGINTTIACNGVKGTTGYTKTLPSGESEYGAWSYGQRPPVEEPLSVLTSMSFNIPLSEAPEATFVPEGEENLAGCPGSSAAPAADKGHLCVYQIAGNPISLFPVSETAFGVTMAGNPDEKVKAQAFGVWVVTAK